MFVADLGHRLIGRIESRQTNTHHLPACPGQPRLRPGALVVFLNQHINLAGFSNVLAVCHRGLPVGFALTPADLPR